MTIRTWSSRATRMERISRNYSNVGSTNGNVINDLDLFGTLEVCGLNRVSGNCLLWWLFDWQDYHDEATCTTFVWCCVLLPLTMYTVRNNQEVTCTAFLYHRLRLLNHTPQPVIFIGPNSNIPLSYSFEFAFPNSFPQNFLVSSIFPVHIFLVISIPR